MVDGEQRWQPVLDLTVLTFLALSLSYTSLDSLRVSEVEPNDTGHVRLEVNKPTLIARWDCPECHRLLSKLVESGSSRSLNVVFTYPQWLDEQTAEDSARSFSQRLGLVGHSGFPIYLDHEFRFATTPLLLVPVAGTTVCRVIASPSLKVVDRYALVGGT